MRFCVLLLTLTSLAMTAFGMLAFAEDASPQVAAVQLFSGTETSTALNWLELSPAVSPIPRENAAFAYDPVSQKIVMFGGLGGSSSYTYLNDTWTFDGTTWTTVNTPVFPTRRAGAGIAYDSQSKKLILFGGTNGMRSLNDTWVWDGATSTWMQAHPANSPSGVDGPIMFSDPLNGHATKFGGLVLDDTMWQWTGTDWAQLNPAVVPSQRGYAAVALDPIRNTAVMFGGIPYNSETWTWGMERTGLSNRLRHTLLGVSIPVRISIRSSAL